MRTTIRALVLILSLVFLIWAYFYVVFWSNTWKWRFWVSGDLKELLYLLIFTYLWGQLIRAVWRAEVRLLFK